MKFLKRTLMEEQVGSVAMESTILLPLMFGTTMALLYLLFMVLAYIAYGNIANNIAHELNMRQSGYEMAYEYYSNYMPLVATNGVAESADGKSAVTLRGLNRYLGTSDVTFNHPDGYGVGTKWLKAGVYFALDKTSRDGRLDRVADQFVLPYVQVDHINVYTSKPLNYNGSETGTRAFANTVVTVDITFKVFNPLTTFNNLASNKPGYDYSNLIKLTTHGYGVIA